MELQPSSGGDAELCIRAPCVWCCAKQARRKPACKLKTMAMMDTRFASADLVHTACKVAAGGVLQAMDYGAYE